MWGAPPWVRTTASGSSWASRWMARAFKPAMRAWSSTLEEAPSRAAAAKAAIWLVASVPERSPPSCPPPRIRGGSFSPFRTYSAPTPLGAWTLCPLMDSRSTPSPLGVKGIFKNPWTASQWSRAGQPVRRMAAAASRTGRMVPSSLFTSIMDTRTVSGRRAPSTWAGSRTPWRPGWR